MGGGDAGDGADAGGDGADAGGDGADAGTGDAGTGDAGTGDAGTGDAATEEGGNGLVVGLVVAGVVGVLAGAGFCYYKKRQGSDSEGGQKESLIVNKVEMA